MRGSVKLRLLPAAATDDAPSIGARAFELLATAVLFLDDARRVVYANPAAENLFELSRRKFAGHTPAELFAACPALTAAIDKAIAGGASYTEQELELAPPGRAKLHLACTVSPIDAGDAALLLEFRHIDQQLKIAREERLREQQQANRELIRSLAHEIKNPLGGIRGAAQLLEGELDRPALVEYTQVIIAEADRLRALVNRLLAPHRAPAYRPINVHEVLVRVKGVVQAEFPAIPIVCDFDSSLPDVEADHEQLMQAALNIVRNAAQALSGSPVAAPSIRARHANCPRRHAGPAPASARHRDRHRRQRPGRSRRYSRPHLLPARVRTRRRQRTRAHDRADVDRAARRHDRMHERAGTHRLHRSAAARYGTRHRGVRLVNPATETVRATPRRTRRYGLGRRRRPFDPLGAREGARARGHRAPDVLVGVRGAAGVGTQRAAGAGLRHPHAGRIGTGAAGRVAGATSAHADHHHDGVLGSRQRRRGIPGWRIRIPAEAVRHRSRARTHSPRGDRNAPRARSGVQRRGRTRDPGPGAGDAGSVSRDRPTVAVDRDRADHRRIGHRQGAGRAGAASPQSPRRGSVRRDQHRRDSEGPARIRAVRARARRLHRCRGNASRPLRAGRGRHAVSRRNRRHAARPAGAPAARAGGWRVLPRRRARRAARDGADHRRDASRSRGARAPGVVSRRPAASPQRRAPAPAAVARTRRGHRAARAALPCEERARSRRRSEDALGCGDADARRLRVPRQRPAAREHLSLAHGDGARAAHRGCGLARRSTRRHRRSGRRESTVAGSKRSTARLRNRLRAASPTSAIACSTNSSAR